jgi:hypothetical protein
MNKKNKKIIFVTAVLVILLVWKFLIVPAVIPEKPIPIIKTATVSVLEKKMSVVSDKTELVVEKELIAKSGDVVKTYNTGRGIIDYGSGTRSIIDYDSDVLIGLGNENQSTISLVLTKGQAWSRVKKILGAGEFYEIKTQNAVAVVRVTEFNVSFKDGITNVLVASGTVQVVPRDPVFGEEISDKAVYVNAGEVATVDKSLIVTVRKITSAEKQSGWYLFNNPKVSGTVTTPRSTPSTSPTPSPATNNTTPTPTSLSTSTPTTSGAPNGALQNTNTPVNATAQPIQNTTTLTPVDNTGGSSGTVVSPVDNYGRPY